MKINANMSAVLTNKQLLRTENKLSASMERLSSGLKINSAGDNPAGMAISNKMKAQIDALGQAKDNASNAVSTLQIADGALNEVSSILQRMRELSVQAANGTYSTSDRETIQDEIDELTKEVDRISADTEYNTKTLLDGSSDVRVYTDAKCATRIKISDTVATGEYSLLVTQAAKPAEWEITLPADGTLEEGEITINNTTIKVSGGMSSGEFYESLRNAAEEAGCTLDGSAADGAVSVLSAFYGSSEEINIEVTEALAKQLGVDQLETAEQDEKGTYSATLSGENAKVGFPDEDPAAAGFTTTATVRAEGNRITVSDQHGFSIDFLLDKNYTEADTADGDGVFTLEVTDIGSMTIQIGGNQYQTMDIRIPEVSSESYYLDTIDVTIYGGPERAMLTLDDAIAELNETRSRIGAFQNRLEYATSSLAETNEDMTSAYSTLLDTDMAEEMSEYTQQSVLQQAAVSVLSQANDLPQTVLSLLQ